MSEESEVVRKSLIVVDSAGRGRQDNPFHEATQNIALGSVFREAVGERAGRLAAG